MDCSDARRRSAVSTIVIKSLELTLLHLNSIYLAQGKGET